MPDQNKNTLAPSRSPARVGRFVYSNSPAKVVRDISFMRHLADAIGIYDTTVNAPIQKDDNHYILAALNAVKYILVDVIVVGGKYGGTKPVREICRAKVHSYKDACDLFNMLKKARPFLEERPYVVELLDEAAKALSYVVNLSKDGLTGYAVHECVTLGQDTMKQLAQQITKVALLSRESGLPDTVERIINLYEL